MANPKISALDWFSVANIPYTIVSSHFTKTSLFTFPQWDQRDSLNPSANQAPLSGACPDDTRKTLSLRSIIFNGRLLPSEAKSKPIITVHVCALHVRCFAKMQVLSTILQKALRQIQKGKENFGLQAVSWSCFN